MPTPQDFSRVLQYVSPLADILVTEHHPATEPFTYGTPHPHPGRDAALADHKLTLVTPDPNDSDKNIWYFVAPRENQDQYNYKISYPYAGMPNYPRITRVYVEPREDYAPLAKGSADPLDVDTVPGHEGAPEEGSLNLFQGAKLVFESQDRIGEDKFDTLFVVVQRIYDNVPAPPQQETWNWEISFPYQANVRFPRYTRRYVIPRNEYVALARGTEDPVFAGSVLISERVDRINDEISDSLYVAVTRIYDHVPVLSDAADLAALKLYGYSISRPHGGSSYPRLTWRFPVKLADYAAATDASLCPIVGYTTLKLISEDMRPDEGAADVVIITRVYDTLSGPVLSEVTKLKNADVPEKFISTKTTTQRTNRTNGATIDTPSGLPTDVGGAILQTSLQPGDGASTIVQSKGDLRIELAKSVLEGYEFDEATGVTMPFSQEIVAAGTIPNGLTSGAQYEQIDPINPYWSLKTTRKSTGLAGNSVTYDRVINYTWPAILIGLTVNDITARDPDTGVDYVERYIVGVTTIDAYSGPCRATVTETWHRDPQTLGQPDQMIPRAIEWDMIFSQGSIRPTLHVSVTFTETTGTMNPKYPYQVTGLEFPATNYTSWPASIIADVDQIRYGGGYKVVRTVVYRPTIA